MKLLYQYKFLFGVAFILIVVGAMYGCDDFLTTPAQGTLDQETLANLEGVEGTLIGAYRLLNAVPAFGGAWGGASSNWQFGSATSDDAYKGSDPQDQPPVTDLELYNWGTAGAEEYLEGKWLNVYEGVSRSNATLRLLNDVIEADPEAVPDATADGIRGEALFLRAHYHYEAWRMWANVPYYFEDDEDFRKSNVNVDVISHVLADLEQAAELMPETSRFGDPGRVNEWTAIAYMGRVQVHTGDYAGGLETLRNVRNNGPFELQENYHQVWTGFSDYYNGPETILAYNASSNDGDTGGDNANWGDRLNFPHNAPFACCGFHQPSQNMVNYFVVDGDGLPISLSEPESWNDRDDNLDSSIDVPVDPRIDWTIGRDGVPYLDWGPHVPLWIRDRAWAGPYSPKKNVHEDASGAEGRAGWTPTQTNSVNIHLYRYADALLLLAEAEVEVGELENAREIVNEIRERAGVVAQGPGDDESTIAVPIDDPSIDWANYQIGLYNLPWTDQVAAREAVRTERRLELAMEGHRLFDLRRWGIAQEILNAYVAKEATRRSYLGAAQSFSDRHQLYPLPASEIQLSRVDGEDRLVQNPGW